MADGDAKILHGRCFLIAEDEAIIAMLLEDVIEQRGGAVLATANACDEAMEALDAHEVDAIILDVHLKGGTSEDVVSVARAKNIPVLVCTGSEAQALSPPFRNLPVLRKPWRSEDLEQALAKLFSVVA